MKIFLILTFFCVTSTNLFSKPDFYGHLNLSGDYYFGDLLNIDSELKSNASRLGVKGNFEITEKITGIYQVEYQIDLEASPTTRNTFLGLKGSFGTFKLGKHDTPLKLAQLEADLFNDTQGDIVNITRGENRPSSYLGYDSPEIAKGLRLSLGLSNTSYNKVHNYECTGGGGFVSTYCARAYSFSSHGNYALDATSLNSLIINSLLLNPPQPFGYSPSSISSSCKPITGLVFSVGRPLNSSNTCKRSFGRNTSFSLNYSSDVINFAIAVQKKGKDGFDHDRMGMTIPAGQSTVGFIYTKTHSSKAAYTFGGSFIAYEAFTGSIKTEFFDGKGTLKIQHSISNALPGLKQSQVGYDHKLSNNFKIFSYYTHRSNDQSFACPVGIICGVTGVIPIFSSNSDSFLSVGIEYKFNYSFTR